LFDEGDRAAIIAHIQKVSLYTEGQVIFILDQYRGKNPYHHLWKRSSRGRYLVNLPR